MLLQPGRPELSAGYTLDLLAASAQDAEERDNEALLEGIAMTKSTIRSSSLEQVKQ